MTTLTDFLLYVQCNAFLVPILKRRPLRIGFKKCLQELTHGLRHFKILRATAAFRNL
jgi:hypothetical protein